MIDVESIRMKSFMTSKELIMEKLKKYFAQYSSETSYVNISSKIFEAKNFKDANWQAQVFKTQKVICLNGGPIKTVVTLTKN